mmetsp:Transcript_61080/g.157983  ORF Transcript_61080/g.157983 Transcript_61080/m.157983 type:complete len:274 (-) Transcript_61080:183-1004(-)
MVLLCMITLKLSMANEHDVEQSNDSSQRLDRSPLRILRLDQRVTLRDEEQQRAIDDLTEHEEDVCRGVEPGLAHSIPLVGQQVAQVQNLSSPLKQHRDRQRTDDKVDGPRPLLEAPAEHGEANQEATEAQQGEHGGGRHVAELDAQLRGVMLLRAELEVHLEGRVRHMANALGEREVPNVRPHVLLKHAAHPRAPLIGGAQDVRLAGRGDERAPAGRKRLSAVPLFIEVHLQVNAHHLCQAPHTNADVIAPRPDGVAEFAGVMPTRVAFLSTQ